MQDLATQVSQILDPGTCMVGMGNYYRSDDAVGLYVIDSIKESAEQMGIQVVNVEEILESYIFTIADMDCRRILLVDAIAADAEPGTILFGQLRDFDNLISNLSTHHLSLKLCEQILEDAGKEIYLLGIVVRNNEFGIGLTSEVENASNFLKKVLTNLCKGEDQ